MVVDWGTFEDATLAFGEAEATDLEDDGECFDNENAADDCEEEFLANDDSDVTEEAAKGK